jgi:hypothetical protein
MAISMRTALDDHDERALLARARDGDYRLLQRELATGELVWEWEHGDAPRPRFPTRCEALDWMRDVLEHGRGIVHAACGGAAVAVLVPPVRRAADRGSAPGAAA